MASSGVKSKKGLKNNITTINSKLKKLDAEMKKLSQAMNDMMKGDSDGPYWNGAKAKLFYERAVKNLTNDIKDYKTAYKNLDNIAVKYESACAFDK